MIEGPLVDRFKEDMVMMELQGGAAVWGGCKGCVRVGMRWCNLLGEKGEGERRYEE